MKRFFRRHFIGVSLLAATLAMVWAVQLIQTRGLGRAKNTLERIRETKKLRMITAAAQNTYFFYKGKPTGFEYDLARAFADYLNVDLDVVSPGWNNMFYYLDDKKGDFIAGGLAITKERLEHTDFSIPYMTIQQRIIHHNLNFGPKDLKDMEFRTFHVRRGTSYQSRLRELKEMGVDFTYVLYDNIPTEELISMVHAREIKFTIADSNIALINRRYFPDIHIGIPIQKKESLAWAVRKDDHEMLYAVNRFLLHANESGLLKQLTNKYYDNIRDFDLYELKKFHERIETRLPRYKDLITAESEKYGFDWRLVAAVIYQESHFNPNAKSFTNVRGLMQVTHDTAREMGISDRHHPEQSIKAGIKYLSRMYKRFSKIQDPYQRMLFALASYNVGYGHVLDAMAIARKKGYAPHSWQALKTTLPLLSKEKVYRQTKHGYARGWEPVHYVEKILTYFDILRQKTYPGGRTGGF